MAAICIIKQACPVLLQANVARGRSRTPPRQRPAPAEQPWLAGTRGSAISKHRRARSNSPGLQLPPRPKVGVTGLGVWLPGWFDTTSMQHK